ncbi:type 2 lanthipeptide synthetase LanM family protein [Ktedonobacter sp. SOSP1-52]|uniref:type 2 lanthipeptide synthetase LanM family protein n=1 Tax=Ktedonobacter sp. SOSP1-52 TaxID=2778366 RepID=UPI001915E13B|nr:type 2 lanthipeptide synthetase LanM family protein [Ktedonobacter sp. SOSP1-52]
MNVRDMAQTSEKPGDKPVSANWYRALTLSERIASIPHSQATNSTSTISDNARQGLARWKEQRPFNEGDYFRQRLEMAGLTEADLLYLLNEPVEELQVRVGATPDWLRTLLAVFCGSSAPDASVLKIIDGEQHILSRSFLAALQPLLVYSYQRLQAGVDQLAESHPTLPFEREQVTASLFKLLPEELLSKSTKTFILELNAARVHGLLQGETPEERFQSFLQRLRSQKHILAFLEEYAVLARLLVETCERWVNTQLELLQRLCLDWESLKTLFAPGSDSGALVEVQTGKGDTHRGGRSVAVLRWSSGLHVVYKPRSLATDRHFSALLNWLNAKGFEPEFRTLKMLERETYGWVEFIEPSTCHSVEEVERFYQREGGYLAILYALHAGDFHAENLIACGEHPFLVDLEVLFLPRLKALPRPPESEEQDLLFDGPPHTVLNVGMLPNRIWSDGENAGIDISAVGGCPGQLAPTLVSVVQGAGTDEMRVEHQQMSLSLGQNLPTLQGGEVDIASYSEHFVTGFATVYRLLMMHREEFLKSQVARFAEIEVRCLPRNTQLYDLILEHSYHPNMLREALERDRLFDRLWFNIDNLPQLKPLLNLEIADLWAGDIPFFYTYASSRDLINGHGIHVPDFFASSGLELVQAFVEQLNEEDLERQSWIARASFVNLDLPSGRKLYPSLRYEPTTTPFSRERVLDAALAAGDRLLELRLENGEFLDWLSITSRGPGRWGLHPSDPDLYNGVAGIVFFLAYLGALTREEKYTSVARHALRMLHRQMKYRRESGRPFTIGGYNGDSSYIYLLSHLGTLWNDPTLFLEAEEYIGPLVRSVAHDEMFDVMAGAAGALAALLNLYQVHPSEATLDAAIKCGKRLLEKKTPQEVGIGWIASVETVALTGMAHGTAGIALNLLRLASVSGDQRFHEAAMQAFAYERHLFSPEANNWPDLRSGDESQDENKKYRMSAWCHGAAGILLARLGCLRFVDDAAIRQEIEVGIETTFAKGLGSSHSLCHGDFGNIDILLTAAQMLERPELLERIERAMPKLLDTIDRQGWVSGAPMGLETPGLMLGLSGTGYALLRLAFMHHVPSVLCLEPPISVK